MFSHMHAILVLWCFNLAWPVLYAGQSLTPNRNVHYTNFFRFTRSSSFEFCSCQYASCSYLAFCYAYLPALLALSADAFLLRG